MIPIPIRRIKPPTHLNRQLHFSWNEIEHEFTICRYGIWVYMYVYAPYISAYVYVFLYIWHRTLDTDEWLELTCNYRVRSQAPQNPIGSCLCGFLLMSCCMQLALMIFKRYRRLHTYLVFNYTLIQTVLSIAPWITILRHSRTLWI